jgi:hypothetical protein
MCQSPKWRRHMFNAAHEGRHACRKDKRMRSCRHNDAEYQIAYQIASRPHLFASPPISCTLRYARQSLSPSRAAKVVSTKRERV